MSEEEERGSWLESEKGKMEIDINIYTIEETISST